MAQEMVRVGILSEQFLRFYFNGQYMHGDQAVSSSGELVAAYSSGKILFEDKLYDELIFEPADNLASFCLREVTIGVAFHWERKTDQCFSGKLHIIVSGQELTAINILPVEDYLTSVISSEMSATASLEFLKAHAVISRSWLMAQIEKNKQLPVSSYPSMVETEEEYIRWYDREDHQLFDVCADDHCQRYQGITRIVSPIARQSVEETCGQILMYDGSICDTRFSKCCGGQTEEFQYAWEPVPHAYLISVPDLPEGDAGERGELFGEQEARKWICSSPEAFCNTADRRILAQVLNDFDRETTDFYRWQVRYTQEELSTLIKKRSGIDFGHIQDIIPLERGKSGRLVKVKIVGTKRTMAIGKELEIRRILSESHLYSSAFVVDKINEGEKGIPQAFILTGAGWGHGVGLCQIGAAVMGEKGYTYDRILLHYFKGAILVKRY